MTNEGHSAQPPSKKALGIITLAALVAGVVLTTLFVLPAEFGIDPTGFGKATGLAKLAPPASALTSPTSAAIYPAVAWRSDVIDIPLKASGDPHREDELEYKVRMRPGDVITYAWSTPAPAEEFYYDFHGETPSVKDGEEPVVVEYKQATGASESGALTAPIPGVHGWYFQNQSEKPVTVRLKISGFYELVPPGEYGNESMIEPLAAKD